MIFYYIKRYLGKQSPHLVYFMLFSLSKVNDHQLLQTCILNNLFISVDRKELLAKIYFKVALMRKRLRYFARVIKCRKMQQAGQYNDFYGTSLQNIKPKQKMMLVIEKSKYWFRITDLIQLWKRALSFNTDLFVTPINFKNPYTGLPFKNHHLYNIFFNIMESPFVVPPIIYAFFKNNFNLKIFKIYYFPQLQDLAIETYVERLRDSKKYSDIIEMLIGHDSLLETIVNKPMPLINKQKVIKKFEFLLRKYYFTIYSINPLLKKQYIGEIQNKINDFLETNVIHNLFA